eukprot:SAG31_NODE_962_length_10731_cov_4.198552_3_plen_258_part_00
MLLASNLPPTGLPYSVATGIPSGGGPEEIAGYVASLRTQGFCVIEHVIPAEQVPAVLASVLAGRRALQAHRESQPPNPPQPAHGGSSRAPMDPTGLPAANATPRPPVATNDIAFNELFAEHVAEPRLTAVAAVMLDAHLRIAQTEVNKSRAAQGPGTEAYETAGGAAGLDRRMRQRGWHSGESSQNIHCRFLALMCAELESTSWSDIDSHVEQTGHMISRPMCRPRWSHGGMLAQWRSHFQTSAWPYPLCGTSALRM